MGRFKYNFSAIGKTGGDGIWCTRWRCLLSHSVLLKSVILSSCSKAHESAGAATPPIDAIVTAEIVALIEDSDSKVYKLSAQCKMYRSLMEKQGKPSDINAISTAPFQPPSRMDRVHNAKENISNLQVKGCTCNCLNTWLKKWPEWCTALDEGSSYRTQVLSKKIAVLHCINLTQMPCSPCCRRGHKLY